MDTFELSVEYNNKTYHYPCTVQQFQYSYRFTIVVDQLEIFFEPDEENQLRARTPEKALLSNFAKEQVTLIAKELQDLLNQG